MEQSLRKSRCRPQPFGPHVLLPWSVTKQMQVVYTLLHTLSDRRKKMTTAPNCGSPYHHKSEVPSCHFVQGVREAGIQQSIALGCDRSKGKFIIFNVLNVMFKISCALASTHGVMQGIHRVQEYQGSSIGHFNMTGCQNPWKQQHKHWWNKSCVYRPVCSDRVLNFGPGVAGSTEFSLSTVRGQTWTHTIVSGPHRRTRRHRRLRTCLPSFEFRSSRDLTSGGPSQHGKTNSILSHQESTWDVKQKYKTRLSIALGGGGGGGGGLSTDKQKYWKKIFI